MSEKDNDWFAEFEEGLKTPSQRAHERQQEEAAALQRKFDRLHKAQAEAAQVFETAANALQRRGERVDYSHSHFLANDLRIDVTMVSTTPCLLVACSWKPAPTRLTVNDGVLRADNSEGEIDATKFFGGLMNEWRKLRPQ